MVFIRVICFRNSKLFFISFENKILGLFYNSAWNNSIWILSLYGKGESKMTNKTDKSGRIKCECGHSLFTHKYIDRNTEPCRAKHCNCYKFKEKKQND